MPTPNKAEAELFDRYIRKWQKKLGLVDWRLERIPGVAKDAMACVFFDTEARLVNYQLGDFGVADITPRSLEETAVHELWHVVLHDLITTARSKKSTRDDVDAAEHRVINLAERLLVPPRRSRSGPNKDSGPT